MGNQGIRQHVEVSSKTGVFHLSKAKLHEFPPDLAKIVDVLRSIDMSDNKISEIPVNIGAFVNLKHLSLNRNHIEVLPDQLGSLTKLESLSLAGNRIRTIPASVQKLKKLKDVNLSENQITNFPLVFCGLPNMVVLNLANNKIQEIPDGVGALQVIELILNQNQIKKISPELASSSNLKTLRLQENCLSLTSFPANILSSSNVSLISIEGNLFDMKDFADLEGYSEYMDRYTATKKKLM
jgi:Leucine-rich repeat (LRR) protein